MAFSSASLMRRRTGQQLRYNRAMEWILVAMASAVAVILAAGFIGPWVERKVRVRRNRVRRRGL